MMIPKGTEYIVREMPDGKWRLLKNEVPMGIFESPAECEAAIHRIIVPNVRCYNSHGEEIK